MRTHNPPLTFELCGKARKHFYMCTTPKDNNQLWSGRRSWGGADDVTSYETKSIALDPPFARCPDLFNDFSQLRSLSVLKTEQSPPICPRRTRGLSNMSGALQPCTYLLSTIWKYLTTMYVGHSTRSYQLRMVVTIEDLQKWTVMERSSRCTTIKHLSISKFPVWKQSVFFFVYYVHQSESLRK